MDWMYILFWAAIAFGGLLVVLDIRDVNKWRNRL